MGEKIVVGPFNKGLKLDREPFVIDNDSFPSLINAYQWRGRVKRKRGTALISRLQRFFNSTISSYNPGAFTVPPTTSFFVVLDGTGSGNLFAGNGTGVGYNIIATFPNASLVPGTIALQDQTTLVVFTDPAKDGTLSPNGSINYATGDFSTGVANAGHNIAAQFNYYPSLPVMGLETLTLTSTQFPTTLEFDTKISYNLPVNIPHTSYDVTFYKNPPSSVTIGYTQKATPTSFSWNGQDYQQFWSTNYQGALWVTNGIDIPFTSATIGMQFRSIIAPGVVVLTPTTANISIATHGLVVGDFVFVNEVIGVTGINFQTGYITTRVDDNNVVVTFPKATLIAGASTGGIVQYLTNTAVPGKDCLRWYDGDPFNGSPQTFVPGNGWVNFMPPISQSSNTIPDLQPAQYYLVGARMIVPFKDRLLFLGPVVQASSGTPKYLQDTVIFSQNGTPFYTCSFSAGANYPLPPLTNPEGYFQLLTPGNIVNSATQTAEPSAYFDDVTGFGGNISAAIDQPLTTVSANEDSLIMGFSTVQTRFLYTGSELLPFNFFLVNSELGSASTFSVVNMDQGVISRGTRGYIITSQTQAQRIDLEIPDQVFEINLAINGNERFCAQRDFISEWIYFTYPVDTEVLGNKFPNQTLQYNYRDNSWGIFNETYTTYGTFVEESGLTWNNVGLQYPRWNQWNDPWNSGTTQAFQPNVIAGNQQGFVFKRNIGTTEPPSLYIQSINGATNTITSPDHTLNNGDYIIITGCIGNIAQQVNGKIFTVFNSTQNTFQLNPSITSASYNGLGVITRLYVPFIQTKQFPTSWGISRKTRLGPQQYLLSSTPNGQIQLLIFLSENGIGDPSAASNHGLLVPSLLSDNNSLIYNTVLFTCPESTNLGLTPANINLQMPTANMQQQIWHRINTSLLGDTVEVALTISDPQMRTYTPVLTALTITGASNTSPCVLNCVNQLSVGQLILISDVQGMTQLNATNAFNSGVFLITAVSSTQITILVDATGFGVYSGGGTVTPISITNQFAEVELHGMILDVSQSALLA